MKLSEYIDYINLPIKFTLLNKQFLFVFSTLMTSIYFVIDAIYNGMYFLASALVINISFIFIYFLLTFADLFIGIYANVFVAKEKFKSEKFLKKMFLIFLGLIMLYITNSLSQTFIEYKHNENPILQAFLHTVVFLFEGIKISLIISFVVYELTSLREKFEIMGYQDVISKIDVFLIPFKKIQEMTEKKFDKVVKEDDEIQK